MRGHKGAARIGTTGTTILSGRVIDVDPARWVCTVRTEGHDSTRTFYDVPIGGPYLHPLNGEGMYAMPDIGALVEICKPSEGDAPAFILAYRPYPSRDTEDGTAGPSVACNRPVMSPGDMALLGRDRNGLLVRRGKVTELIGGALSRIMLLGKQSIIRFIAQHFAVETFAGSIRLGVERPENDPDGHQSAFADMKIKEFSDDRSYIARVQLGTGIDSTTEGEPDGGAGTYGPAPTSTEMTESPAFRLRIYADGAVSESDLETVSSFSADKSGSVELMATGAVLLGTRGTSNSTVSIIGGDLQILTDADILLNPTGKVVVSNGISPVIVDASFSANSAAAWTTVSTLAKILGIPTASIDAHIAALNAGMYSSQKLFSL